jgi:hypothetical protein
VPQRLVVPLEVQVHLEQRVDPPARQEQVERRRRANALHHDPDRLQHLARDLGPARLQVGVRVSVAALTRAPGQSARQQAHDVALLQKKVEDPGGLVAVLVRPQHVLRQGADGLDLLRGGDGGVAAGAGVEGGAEGAELLEREAAARRLVVQARRGRGVPGARGRRRLGGGGGGAARGEGEAAKEVGEPVASSAAAAVVVVVVVAPHFGVVVVAMRALRCARTRARRRRARAATALSRRRLRRRPCCFSVQALVGCA